MSDEGKTLWSEGGESSAPSESPLEERHEHHEHKGSTVEVEEAVVNIRATHVHVYAKEVVSQPPPRTEGQAVTAILTVGGSIMPGKITVDETNQEIAVNFVDDKGDTDAAAPDGAVITYSGDNPAVASVDSSSGKITPVAEGTFNASATIADASGQPIMEPDGQTPFSVQPAAIEVVAGAAVGAELGIKQVS